MTILTKKLAIAAAAVAGVLAGAGTASAQVSNFHPCATQNPGPTEVFIFRDGNFLATQTIKQIFNLMGECDQWRELESCGVAFDRVGHTENVMQ